MADQTITQSQTTIPEYARPYVEQMLGRSQALTDVNQNPYQQYSGERIAQFSPLQQQAFQGVAGLGVNPYTTGAASGIQGLTGQAMGTQYAPNTNSFTQPGMAQQYMSPYMQNVVDIQKREAMRSNDIGRTQRNAQAVGAGAFGGSRQAIVEAEANRNLMQQLNDIQAQGSQAAYTQGAQQFNTENQLGEQSRQFGAGLGLQGLQTGLQGYGALGALGQQAYNQQTGALGLQNQFGTQQQQQVQNVLSQDYQDFLNQQNYPYKQLSYMSDMLRGVPLSQQSSNVYQSPPSMLSQVAGLGIAGLGLMK